MGSGDSFNTSAPMREKRVASIAIRETGDKIGWGSQNTPPIVGVNPRTTRFHISADGKCNKTFQTAYLIDR